MSKILIHFQRAWNVTKSKLKYLLLLRNTCVRFVYFNRSWNSTIIIANRFFLLSFFIYFNSICLVFVEKPIWVKCSDRLQVNFKLCVSYLLNVLPTINYSNCVHVLIAFKRIQSNWSAVGCFRLFFGKQNHVKCCMLSHS